MSEHHENTRCVNDTSKRTSSRERSEDLETESINRRAQSLEDESFLGLEMTNASGMQRVMGGKGTPLKFRYETSESAIGQGRLQRMRSPKYYARDIQMVHSQHLPECRFFATV